MLLAVNMPRAGAARRAAGLLQGQQFVGRHLALLLCRRADEHVDQVDRLAVGRAAGLHRPAADEDRRDVAAHGAHEHAGHDLVAVGDADHAVEAMGLEHRLDAVGDDLAAGQRILHARVAHGDAVVDADRVEDERHAARLADALLDVLADLVQVDVAGNDVRVAVANGDERLAEIAVGHAGGPEQAAMGGSGVAQFDSVGSHGSISLGIKDNPPIISHRRRERRGEPETQILRGQKRREVPPSTPGGFLAKGKGLSGCGLTQSRQGGKLLEDERRISPAPQGE